MKIYVIIEGGVLQSVFTDEPTDGAEVVLVDYDNIEGGDTEPELPAKENRNELW